MARPQVTTVWNFWPLNLVIPTTARTGLNVLLWPLWLVTLPIQVFWNFVPNVIGLILSVNNVI